VFHTDVAKVDQDVAMVVHVCCKLFFSMFHLFFSDVCCKCVYLDVAYVFKHMMQVFYLDVAYVYNGFECFSDVFASVSDACFKCFICFSHMLQLLHLDVSKLN
jgi:hypothetical protein